MGAFAPAPAVAEIATSLIVEHHGNLMGAPIVYVFIDPAPRVKGGIVLGRARVVKGLNAFLVALAGGEVDVTDDEPSDEDHAFFAMEIAYEEWHEASDGQRRALVDHELCHFYIDPEEGKLSIRGHDIEEFGAVVRRHGLWRKDLEWFAAQCSAASSSCFVSR